MNIWNVWGTQQFHPICTSRAVSIILIIYKAKTKSFIFFLNVHNSSTINKNLLMPGSNFAQHNQWTVLLALLASCQPHITFSTDSHTSLPVHLSHSLSSQHLCWCSYKTDFKIESRNTQIHTRNENKFLCLMLFFCFLSPQDHLWLSRFSPQWWFQFTQELVVTV